MRNTILRDASTGRILGKLDDSQWFSKEDEHWHDYKCKDVRFPSHNQYMSSPVVVSYIGKK